jgi:hypothetical protein
MIAGTSAFWASCLRGPLLSPSPCKGLQNPRWQVLKPPAGVFSCEERLIA